MSISTKRGDDGETDLLYGRRVVKTHPRIVAVGAVDELNASLGLARCHAGADTLGETIATIQEVLIGLMGELATAGEDFSRYQEDGYPQVKAEQVDALSALIDACEEGMEPLRGWAIPGASGDLCAASLDYARTVCRRAERAVLEVAEGHKEVVRYLNRLSDLLWLWARERDAEPKRLSSDSL